MKPGYKTTEFWGKTALQAAVLIAALSSHLSPKWAALAGALSEGLYALSRGWAKGSVPVVPAPIPPAPVVPPPAT